MMVRRVKVVETRERGEEVSNYVPIAMPLEDRNLFRQLEDEEIRESLLDHSKPSHNKNETDERLFVKRKKKNKRVPPPILRKWLLRR